MESAVKVCFVSLSCSCFALVLSLRSRSLVSLSFSCSAHSSCSAVILSFRSCLLFRSCSLVSLSFKIIKFRWFYTGFVKIRVFEKTMFREPFWTDLVSLPLAFWLLLGPLGASWGPFWALLGPLGSLLGPPGAPFGASWRLLGRSWGAPGATSEKRAKNDPQNDRFGVPKWLQNRTKNAPKSKTKSNIEKVPLQDRLESVLGRSWDVFGTL